MTIYHITTQDEWTSAQSTGAYRAPSLQSEGFIHCSTVEQIVTVANAFYREIPALILLCVETEKLDCDVKWEAPVHPDGRPVEDTTERFPHVYGMIPCVAVEEVLPMPKNQEGLYTLPDKLA